MPASPDLTACLSEHECPWTPRAIPPGGSRFRLGDRVLVHQHAGLDLSRTPEEGFAGIRRLPHGCARPEFHWQSRVVGWSDFHGMVDIATPFRPSGNPCSAEWVYGDRCLEPLGGGDDWADASRYAPGARVRFRWDCPRHLHYRHGTLLDAVVEAAHIEPGDWLCTFVVPGWTSVERRAFPPWRFVIAVNEEEFVE